MVDVTLEKCLSYIDNRFKLVVLASQRVHDLNVGAIPVVEREKSKNTVIALREIADNKLDHCVLFNLVVQRCQKYISATTDINQKGFNQFNYKLINSSDLKLNEEDSLANKIS